MKCDKKRRKEDLGDEKTVSTEETMPMSVKKKFQKKAQKKAILNEPLDLQSIF